MLTKTEFLIPIKWIDAAYELTNSTNFKQTINQPTGDFFYDPWIINEEFSGTPWELILNSLPFDKGEARIINLKPTQSYCSHSDIDDRWHLNIFSKNSYLINLDEEKMFELKTDGYWYDLNAGYHHTAVNFGNRPRIQLVIRKLLQRSTRKDLVKVYIKSKIADLDDARFEFDNSLSKLLNKYNKNNLLNNFSFSNQTATFDVAPEVIYELQSFSQDNFEIML
jgi:hypothetical protein